MILLCTGILAIVCYVTCIALLAQEVMHDKSATKSILFAWIAVGLHVSYIAVTSWQNNVLDYGFFSVGSIISVIVALLLLLTILNKPIDKLGLAIFPIAALMLGLTFIYPSTDPATTNPTNDSWQMNTHIFSSIIAFSLLNIAALQAVFLFLQEQRLRKHPPQKIIPTLPPLQTMESLLFQLISTGIVFLTVSLLSGFIFIDDLLAQHLVHKTVLSVLAWLIFSALLYGRIRYGWRGGLAIQWTLAGFTSLLLAYFGSKMVLELILQK